MSVRLRRLQADYERICTMFTGQSRIRLVKTLGDPPEKYQFEYLVQSLQKDPASHQLRSHGVFTVEIVLTGSYPRLPPQCKMLTAVFHPNIAPHAICIGDHWAAGESLPNLIVRIAEMLAYQSYNVKSPLNGEAAKWVQLNPASLPLDHFDFSAILSAGEAIGRNQDGTLRAGSECANCGKRAQEGTLAVCMEHHTTCEACSLQCGLCGAVLCLKCSLARCPACGRFACRQCVFRCPACQVLFCRTEGRGCHVCGGDRCPSCLVECDTCKEPTCMDHLRRNDLPEGRRYVCDKCGNSASPLELASSQSPPMGDWT